MVVTGSRISPDVCKVAVIDDSYEHEPLDYMFLHCVTEIAGFHTVQLAGKIADTFDTLDDMVKRIAAQSQAAICTHRLGMLDGKPLYGAQLVAALYDLKIPALLVTQYSDIDKNMSIRKWKDKVPIVLHPREFEPDTVQEYLEECAAELQGQPPEHRIPYRVLLRVHNVESIGEETAVDVEIESWDHCHVIRLPLSLIPEHIHADIWCGAWLYADVNIKAQYQEDLYFRNIELTSEPKEGEEESLALIALVDARHPNNTP
jgi:hypothetical protein